MRFEISKYYQSKESDVMDYVKAILSNSSITNSMQFLKKLIRWKWALFPNILSTLRDMWEIPNNVILIDAFTKIFDGFSIGSNDLTQLTLGADRDSEIVAFDFDECDPSVKEMICLAVEGACHNHQHSGICG